MSQNSKNRRPRTTEEAMASSLEEKEILDKESQAAHDRAIQNRWLIIFIVICALWILVNKLVFG